MDKPFLGKIYPINCHGNLSISFCFFVMAPGVFGKSGGLPRRLTGHSGGLFGLRCRARLPQAPARHNRELHAWLGRAAVAKIRNGGRGFDVPWGHCAWCGPGNQKPSCSRARVLVDKMPWTRFSAAAHRPTCGPMRSAALQCGPPLARNLGCRLLR